MAKPTDPLQILSKEVFDATHRLSVSRALLSSDAATWDMAAIEALDVSTPSSCVKREVATLVDPIKALKRTDFGRQVFYSRAKSAWWALAEELIAGVEPAFAPVRSKSK